MRLRVVHIIGLAEGGGGRTVGLNTIAPSAGYCEAYAILGRKGDLPELLRERGVKVETVGLDHATRSILAIPAIARILRRIKPHLVVNYGQPAGLVGAMACRLAGVRQVLYVTCFPSFYTDWDIFRVIRNRIVERLSCQAAVMVGCPSQAAVYQYLQRQLVVPERVTYFPLGVDIKDIRPASDKARLRQELGLPVDKPLVVSVSRLTDQKRVDWLVRAWAEVEQQHAEAHLCIVGDGDEKVKLERLAVSLGLKRCHFLGYRTGGAAYFAAADLTVVTTMYEIPGLTVLEAMAAECPVVVTAADGVTESVLASAGGGHLVPSADVSALADGVLGLLRDPAARQAMGKCGRVYVENRHTLNGALEFQRQLIERLGES